MSGWHFPGYKNALQKNFHFFIVLGTPWAAFGHLFGHPVTILAASGLPELQKLSSIPAKARITTSSLHIRRESTENRKEPAVNPPRFRREPPIAHRIPAYNPPRTSRNPPRTRRTNSNQTVFANRICEKDFLLRRTLQQKRLEQKWGGGAPPFGGLQLNKPSWRKPAARRRLTRLGSQLAILDLRYIRDACLLNIICVN